MSTKTIAERLHEIMIDAFDPAELGKFVRARLGHWLYNIARPGATHDTQVSDVIDWAQRQGILDTLIRGAASSLPKRQDMADLLNDWNSKNAAPSTSTSSTVDSTDADSDATATDPVSALAVKFNRLRKETVPGPDRAAAFDSIVRMASELSSKDAGLAELCLSQAAGPRLAAVIRLECNPNPDFVYWLSERVYADDPLIGVRASMALWTAARELRESWVVLDAVARALARIAPNAEADDRRWPLLAAVNHLRERIE